MITYTHPVVSLVAYKNLKNEIIVHTHTVHTIT